MDFAQFTWNVVPFLSVFAVIGHVIIAVAAATFVYEFSAKKSTRISTWLGKNGLVLMLAVALTATLGSLYFSEISGWTPCKFCWYQRIFMYPQVLLLCIALWRRDRNIAPYILALCVLGMAFAAYHYSEQVQAVLQPPADPAVPCDTSGVSCAKTPFFYFGYITIPMMALTAFALNAVGSLQMLRGKIQS